MTRTILGERLTIGWKALQQEIKDRIGIITPIVEIASVVREMDWLPKRKIGRQRVWNTTEVAQIVGRFKRRKNE